MKKFLSMLLLVAMSVTMFANNTTENQPLKKEFKEILKKNQKTFGSVEIYSDICIVKHLKQNNMNNFKNTSELITNLNEIKNGVSFVNILYTNQVNELQKTTFNVGVSYNKAKEKDIEFLKTFDVETLKSNMSTELLNEAKDALLKALLKPNKNQSEAQKNAYEHLINGIKQHKETKDVFIFGMKVKKTIVKQGEYKKDTRKPLTKAKDLIRSKMKSTQYRQYKIESTAKVKLRGNELTFEA